MSISIVRCTETSGPPCPPHVSTMCPVMDILVPLPPSSVPPRTLCICSTRAVSPSSWYAVVSEVEQDVSIYVIELRPCTPSMVSMVLACHGGHTSCQCIATKHQMATRSTAMWRVILCVAQYTTPSNTEKEYSSLSCSHALLHMAMPST